ncbi:MAG: glycosyl hydrolase family 8 [bacterium]|nr:glycosyl hydrolase family 8 [bacterium]
MGTSILAFNIAQASEHNIYDSIAMNHPFDAVFSMLGETSLLIGIILLVPLLYRKSRALYNKTSDEKIAQQDRIGESHFRIIAFFLICIGVLFILLSTYLRSSASRIPLTFSTRAMSEALWETYKKTYIDHETQRTFDPSRENITTSEAQSYTMFRAVLLDDKETFDKSWKWTKENLSRKDDALFAWKFEEGADGTYGIQEHEGGQNTASDADTDIALSLIFAYARWHEPHYIKSAEAIVRAIWEHEVVTVSGKPYLTANNIEKDSGKNFVILNPSYFAPYAYRTFSKIDPDHPWLDLVDSSYAVIEQSLLSTLNKQASVELIPDWIILDTITGKISATNSDHLTTDYSYDAMRLPWRLAVDWKWNREERAQNILSKNAFLLDRWQSDKKLYSAYGHDGTLNYKYEAPAIYGGTLGYFVVTNEEVAEAMYREKLLILFDPDNNTWREPLSYYDDNWVWLGMALYNDHVPNLAERLSYVTIDVN